MAKKQKSFADKASGRGTEENAVMVKYVKSIKSEKTGFWRFNEQMVKLRDGENLDAALKRMNEAENLVDIDLSNLDINNQSSEEKAIDNQDVAEEAVISESQSTSDEVEEEE